MSSNADMFMNNPETTVEKTGPSERRGPSHEDKVNVILAVLLVTLFAWAYIEAGQWSFRAGIFPRLVTGLSLALATLYLVQALVRLWPRKIITVDSDLITVHPDDAVEQDGEEDIFRSASGRRWASSLGWAVLFFCLLYVGGLFVAAIVFSLFYLRFPGERTWIFSAIYAVMAAAVLYAIFEIAIGVPTPSGILVN